MNCEQVRIAAMALADGETPPLPRAAIEVHLAECAECRQELEEMQALGRLWEAQSRQTHAVDLWPQVAGRLQSPVGRAEKHRWLTALAALLVVFKLIEFIPNRSLGMWVQLVPLLLAAAVFAVVGQNPFQIKTELRSQEESI
jgi:predicted anti-sigma-YlaC factor YlaD